MRNIHKKRKGFNRNFPIFATIPPLTRTPTVTPVTGKMATDSRSFHTWVTLCFIVLCGVGTWAQGNRFFTKPPNEGYPRPTIINGIIHNLYHIPEECQLPRVYNYPTGGIIVDKRALIKAENPHKIDGNIQIAPGACLYIEPGTVLQFSPGYGIRVNGTLIAWVSKG